MAYIHLPKNCRQPPDKSNLGRRYIGIPNIDKLTYAELVQFVNRYRNPTDVDKRDIVGHLSDFRRILGILVKYAQYKLSGQAEELSYTYDRLPEEAKFRRLDPSQRWRQIVGATPPRSLERITAIRHFIATASQTEKNLALNTILGMLEKEYSPSNNPCPSLDAPV
jgi:hypothetical protein